MLAFYLSLIDDNDRALFEKIYLANRKQMFYLARSIVKSDEDAEDIVHDVFCTVASLHMHVIKNALCDADIRNYLLKSAKNTALNTLRKKKTRALYEEFDENTIELSDRQFLDELCLKIEFEELISAINGLDEKYREVLYYRFVIGMTTAELAKFLDRKAETVNKQISRGKAQLLNAYTVKKGGK